MSKSASQSLLFYRNFVYKMSWKYLHNFSGPKEKSSTVQKYWIYSDIKCRKEKKKFFTWEAWTKKNVWHFCLKNNRLIDYQNNYKYFKNIFSLIIKLSFSLLNQRCGLAVQRSGTRLVYTVFACFSNVVTSLKK